MKNPPRQLCWQERVIQRYLLPGIALAYVLSAFWPAGGVWLRSYDFLGSGEIGLGSTTGVNILLAVLLFNTGLAVPMKEMMCLTRHPRLVILGLSVRITSCALIVFCALAAGFCFHGSLWNAVLVGLILITVMPVANSSAGWSHHSEANVGLSMWLIVISVLISPWLVPGLLQIASWFVESPQEVDFHNLARGYAGSFVMIWVIIPATLGVFIRSLVLRDAYPRWKLVIKGVTFGCLVLLNYANGSVSLPEVLKGGHGSVMGLSLVAAVLLCSLLFLTAWWVGRLCRLKPKDRISVMYSTAMSNTGVALVLATTLLPMQLPTHLVIILYTLMQHIVAGFVDRIYGSVREQLAAPTHSLRISNSSTMTSQPVLKTESGRPTTHTGSQAAMIEPEAVIPKGS